MTKMFYGKERREGRKERATTGTLGNYHMLEALGAQVPIHSNLGTILCCRH